MTDTPVTAPTPDLQPIERGPFCEKHGCELEWVTCWNGCDEGFFDEWETDPINFSEGEEYRRCDECHGRGGFQLCPECAPGAFYD